MKEFDFKAAQAGAAVCTRDGRPVSICRGSARRSCDSPYQVEAFVTDNAGGMWLSSYTMRGKWSGVHEEGPSGTDLMMRDDDYLERLRDNFNLNDIWGNSRFSVQSASGEKAIRASVHPINGDKCVLMDFSIGSFWYGERGSIWPGYRSVPRGYEYITSQPYMHRDDE